ncbi:disease resistance protein RPV1-like isoform X3 [Vitis riparia]|uniref:disease resistance protein RPV1-like isoform X3 n=1 Tax=Vitis riparia TaxID=96939 RepID=UPI00155B2350|nr:disease resistance protein RPV1-like isoform X3 [Vitis riparia]
MASTSSRFYDVFLSFIGVDTRDSFTAHLHRQLCRNGINTFLDDEGLERGQVITPALVTAIENSKVSIVVLSENFASSRWCLEELVKILECRRTKGQRVIPIFYNIDPSDVRNQRGKFGETMVKHEKNLANRERVQIWRDALTEVADLSGWHSRNKNIVEDVPWGVHVNFLKAERSLHRWALEDLQRIHAAEGLAADEKVVEWKCMFLKMLVIGCMLITQMVSSGFSPLPSKESKPNELPNFHSRSVSAFLKL